MGFFEKLKLFRIRKYVIPEVNLFGSEDDYSKADAKTLRKAYHENLFIKAIVNLSANFVFPAPPRVQCEDEQAQELLNTLYKNYYETFLSVARDASLTGDGFLKVVYNGKVDLVEVFPSKVVIIPSPLDLRDYERIEITYTPDINYSKDFLSVREIWDKEKVELYVNDKLYQRIEHGLGEIPVIHVAYNRFSNELYGSGDVNEAVFRLVQQYEKVLEAVVKSFVYLGKPIPVFYVENTEKLEELLSKTDLERLTGLFLGKEDKAEFLEPRNILKDAKDILELIFYNIVVLSETPEFLLGVHTPSSWASVKEQLHPIIRKTKRYQSIWKEKLKELNRIVLKYLEKFEGRKFATYETEIEFPEVEVKDVKDYAQALAQLTGAGIMKPEEAREVLRSLLPSFNQVVENLSQEQEPYSPDKNWDEYT